MPGVALALVGMIDCPQIVLDRREKTSPYF